MKMKDMSNKLDSAPHIQDLSIILTLVRPDGTNYTKWALNAENKI